MSVENFDHIGGAIEFLGERTPETCFYCGKPLAGITAYWHGAGGQSVALHPDCGLEFGVHITRDALNAKLIRDGKSAAAGIPPGLGAPR